MAHRVSSRNTGAMDDLGVEGFEQRVPLNDLAEHSLHYRFAIRILLDHPADARTDLSSEGSVDGAFQGIAVLVHVILDALGVVRKPAGVARAVLDRVQGDVLAEAAIAADLPGGFDALVDHVPSELQTLGIIGGDGLLVDDMLGEHALNVLVRLSAELPCFALKRVVDGGWERLGDLRKMHRSIPHSSEYE